MCNAILQDQVRSQDLGIVDEDIVALDSHCDSGARLRQQLGAIRKRRDVADEIGHHVAVHQGGRGGIGARDVCAGEGAIGGDEDGDTSCGVEFGGEI